MLAIAGTAAVVVTALISKLFSSSESQPSKSNSSQESTEVKELRRQLQELTSNQQSLSSQYRKIIDENNQQMSQIQSDLQTCKQQVQNRKSQFNKLQKKMTESQIQYENISSQNKKQKTQLNSLQKNLTQLQTALDTVTKELNYYRELAKKQGDPKTYNQGKQKIFISFLDNLKTYDFTASIPKEKNHRYHMVMGLISAGKSSLLKKITGVQLKTGQGETTHTASRIGAYKSKFQTVQVFDSPGINESFSCYDLKTLALLYAMDQIFIVYRDCLKNVNQLIRIINAIKPNVKINLIRTHCDMFTSEDDKTCQQEIQVDYNYMKSLGIPCQIYAFSSKKSISMDFMDNKKVASLIRRDQ